MPQQKTPEIDWQRIREEFAARLDQDELVDLGPDEWDAEAILRQEG